MTLYFFKYNLLMFAQVGWFFLHLYCWFIAQERDALLSLTADRKVPQCLQLAEPIGRVAWSIGKASIRELLQPALGVRFMEWEEILWSGEIRSMMVSWESMKNMKTISDLNCVHMLFARMPRFSCIVMYCCRLVWWAEPSCSNVTPPPSPSYIPRSGFQY